MPLHLHPPHPNPATTLPEGREVLERDWCWPEQCRLVGLLLPAKGWQIARMVKGIPILPPHYGQMLWQHPGQRNGPSASSILQAARFTMGETWLMDHPSLPGGAGLQGLPPTNGFQGKLRLLRDVDWRNGKAGHGTPEVCCPFQNTSRGALWSSARAWQMPHPCDWEWQLVWPQDVRSG